MIDNLGHDGRSEQVISYHSITKSNTRSNSSTKPDYNYKFDSSQVHTISSHESPPSILITSPYAKAELGKPKRLNATGQRYT